MNKQIIKKGGKPAFVVIPIEEWRRIEATLEDRADTVAVRAFLKNPTETFPDSVVAAILEGTHPVKAMREHRGMTQAKLAQAGGTTPSTFRRSSAAKGVPDEDFSPSWAKPWVSPPTF